MTQQNAALVEQSAAAADSLKEQAVHLARAVAVFKLSRAETKVLLAGAQASARSGRLPVSGRVPALVDPIRPGAGAAPPPAKARSGAVAAAPSKHGDDWEEF
jgi:hypothetical protein